MSVLSVQPMAASTPTTGTSGSSSTDAGGNLQPDDFVTLLVAQLKSQDPFNPMDPTTFVNQLVQFNTLEQVIGIRQELAPTTATGDGSATGGANPAANATTSK